MPLIDSDLKENELLKPLVQGSPAYVFARFDDELEFHLSVKWGLDVTKCAMLAKLRTFVQKMEQDAISDIT
jgi:hypothetical protein